MEKTYRSREQRPYFIRRDAKVGTISIIVGASMMFGCSGDNGPANASGNMDILSISSQGTIQCEGETCAEHFEVELQDVYKDPSMYYWVRFLGPVDICSNPVQDASGGTTIIVPIDIYYYAEDPLTNGLTEFQVLAFKSSKYSHACTNEYEDGAPYDGTVIVDMLTWGPDCEINCCSRPGPDTGRFHAQAFRDTVGVYAASAKITAQYGTLCKELYHCCEIPTHQNAFVSIHNNSVPNSPLWAETGYRKYVDSLGQIQKGWYGEFWYDGIQAIWQNANWIVESNDEHTYESELFEYPGSHSDWVFKFNGVEHPACWDQNYWLGKQGTSVHFGGELLGYETDLPGTVGAKCLFTDCEFRTIYLSGPQSMMLYSAGARIGGGDLSHWKIERINDATFSIFDSDPL